MDDQTSQDKSNRPAVAKLRESWESGSIPQISSFLVGLKDPTRIETLIELVSTDMSCRAVAGFPKSLQSYLEEWPELIRDDGTPIPNVVKTTASGHGYGDTEVVSNGAKWVNMGMASNVRCPFCAALVMVTERSSDSERLTCSSCASPFRWDPVTTRGTDPVSLPDTIGKYDVLGVLGRGAFGLVYKAKDWELGRVVAVKLPRSGDFSSDEEQQRFIREARSAASLDHPGIVRVYEITHEGNAACIVSEFIDGLSLAEVLTGPRLSHQRVAEILTDVADALAHAHSKHIIHRDIKPGNILIDPEGKPHLTDFGLARHEDEDVTVTQSGQILGTPAYMSPEQAEGDQAKVGTASDIYSIGAMMYEMLTGDIPFRGSRRMLLYQILHDEPVSPRRLNDRIPRDLDTICLKCLSKDPDRRYASAGLLSADLKRWLAGEPIEARPITSTERLIRWCRRRPRLAGMTALAGLLLIIIASGSTAVAFKMNRLRLTAEAARLEAEGERDQKERARKKQRNDALSGSQSFAEQSARAARSGRFDEATIRAQAAMRLFPDGPWGDYALGVLAYEQQELPAAEKHLERAISLSDEHLPSEAVLARVRASAEQIVNAQAIAGNPGVYEWEKIRDSAEVLFDARKYETAMKGFTRAVQLLNERTAEIPTDADWSTLQQTADALLKKGKLVDTMSHLEAAKAKLQELKASHTSELVAIETALKETASRLERETRFLRAAILDCDAWIRCRGFYESIRDLPQSVQSKKLKAKLVELGCPPAMLKYAGSELREVHSYRGSQLQPFYGFRLRIVHATNTSVRDLSPLRGMPLEYLNLTSTQLRDLGPLQGMPLRRIALTRTEIDDLSLLRGMPLEWVSVKSTRVSDLRPLSGMSLTDLDVSFTKVVDLSPLRGMNLEVFKCEQTQISDISVLRGMPLKQLNVDGTKVSDYSVLSGMKLEVLHCSGTTGIGNLQILNDMPLKKLVASGSDINNLYPLQNANLKHLDIEATNVSDLSPIAGMPISYLNVNEIVAGSYEPLRGMPIEFFKITSDQQRELDQAGILTTLPIRRLVITHAKDLTSLKGLQLQMLHVGSRPSFTDLAPLSGMPLEELTINEAPVTDLSPLAGMKLKSISLKYTKVSDLTPLRGMPLEEIHPPTRKQLTEESLSLLDQLAKSGSKVIW